MGDTLEPRGAVAATRRLRSARYVGSVPLSTYDRGEPIRLLPTDCHATNEQKEDAHDRHSNR